ncbi:MAG: phosphotransferase [Candidatus Nanohaloarchaea archaeon]|nr:phosphotransferase [Candidatus Nanohaloarchaea archaeon]
MDWDDYIGGGILHGDADVAPIESGAIKTTYRIDTESDSYILQTVDTGDEWRLHQQREVYDRLSDTAVPSPDVVYDAADEEVPYQVVEAIDGDNLNDRYHEMPDSTRLAVVEEAGRYLAAAHDKLSMDDCGWLYGTENGLEVDAADSWRSFYRGFLHDMLDTVEDGPLDRDDLTDELRATVDATIDNVPVDPDTSIVHRDYDPDNLVEDDGEIAAVLDWGNAFAGDPLYDYARAEHSFAGRFADDERVERTRERFRASYEQRQPIDDRLYEVYRLGALIDQAAALTWCQDNAFDFDDSVFDGHRDVLREQVDRVD